METHETSRFLRGFYLVEREGAVRAAWDAGIFESWNRVIACLEDKLGVSLEGQLTENSSVEELHRDVGDYLLAQYYETEGVRDMDLAEFIQKARDQSVTVKLPEEEKDSAVHIEITESESWVYPKILENAQEISMKFTGYIRENNTGMKLAKLLFSDIVAILKIHPSTLAVEQFDSMVAGLKDIQYIGLSGIVQLIGTWAEEHKDSVLTLEARLHSTYEEFSSLSDSLQGMEFPELTEILTDISRLISEHKTKPRTSPKPPTKNLFEIFKFYAKVITSAGTVPTFDEINSDNSHLTLPKFFKFAIDFKLTSAKLIPKGKLAEIFKKNAKHGRYMLFQQFQSAIDQIALSIYNTPDNRTQLFSHMQIKHPELYMKKLQANLAPFHSVPGDPRIPLASRLYKSALTAKRKQELQDWQLGKQTRPRAPPEHSSTTFSQHKPHARYSMNGYSAKKRQQIPSHHSLHGPLKPLTFEALGQLAYSDLAGDGAFTARSDDLDNIYQQLYNKKEENYSRILRLQDQRLQRGLCVARKALLP